MLADLLSFLSLVVKSEGSMILYVCLYFKQNISQIIEWIATKPVESAHWFVMHNFTFGVSPIQDGHQSKAVLTNI